VGAQTSARYIAYQRRMPVRMARMGNRYFIRSCELRAASS
jgi:hypothetical protein